MQAPLQPGSLPTVSFHEDPSFMAMHPAVRLPAGVTPRWQLPSDRDPDVTVTVPEGSILRPKLARVRDEDHAVP
jgi:hypothetical protein